MEEIFEFLFRFLLIFPGVFLRWLAGGFKKPFLHYMDDGESNSFIGLMFVLGLCVFILFLTR
ncbi:MAG TPA: hypothetical protein VF622_01960 [Segetibacter sp.]